MIQSMKKPIVAPANLEKASNVLAGFGQIELPAPSRSTRQLTPREIVEMIAFGLTFDNGAVAIDATIGFSALVFQRMGDLAYSEEKAERTIQAIVEKLTSINNATPADIATTLGIEQKGPRDASKAEFETKRQVIALEIQIRDSLEQILGLEGKTRLPKAITAYFRSKGITGSNIPFFLRELANAILHLAFFESKYKREAVRPHLLAILQNKNPPPLVVPAGIL